LFFGVGNDLSAGSGCPTFCVTVVDADTSRPVESFGVAVVRKSQDPFAPVFSVPPGFPPFLGDIVTSFDASSRDGTFTLPSLPPPGSSLAILAKDFLFQEIREPREGESRVVRLEKAYVLTGRVQDQAGRSIPGVEVHLRAPDNEPENSFRHVEPRAVTGPRGEFEVRQLHTKMIPVELRHPRFPPLHAWIDVSDRSRHTFTLGREKVCWPLAGTVSSLAPGHRFIAVEAVCGKQATTSGVDSEGRFAFDCLPSGFCSLSVHILADPVDELWSGWRETASSATTTVRHDGPRQDLVLDLPRSADVSIALAAKDPRDGSCRVFAEREGGRRRTIGLRWNERVTARLDEGTWALRIECEARDHRVRSEAAHVTVDNDVRQSVSLHLMNPVAVSVLVNGEPAKRIELSPVDPSITTRATAVSVKPGTTISGLEEGGYELVADGRFVTRAVIPAPVVRTISTHRLAIEVGQDSAEAGSQNLRFTRIEVDGEFQFRKAPLIYNLRPSRWQAPDLLPGTYEVTISAAGFVSRSISVNLDRDIELTVAALEKATLPPARPEAELDETERAILLEVLQDVRARVAEFVKSQSAVVLLAQTDPMLSVEPTEWLVEEEQVDVVSFLREVEAPGESIRVDNVARDAGLEAVALPDLPIERHRVGTTLVAMQLVDHDRLVDTTNDGVVLLATTRPAISRGGDRAIVVITSVVVDFFNWIYLVEIENGRPRIRCVAEPEPSC
jgi:hypothetical protein